MRPGSPRSNDAARGLRREPLLLYSALLLLAAHPPIRASFWRRVQR
jgi:hypothetical protein